MFISMLLSDPQAYFMRILLVGFSVCVHEYCHAAAALWQGDSTAADSGHLTLNPLVQMGIVPILILLFVGITWGAAPVNPARMRHRYSNALVSFAGPFSNVILFFLFSLGLVLMPSSNKAVLILLGTGAILNIVLFIFNMLPVPMLDGYKVFSYFIPALDRNNSELKNAFMLIIFLFAFFSFEKIYWLGNLITFHTVVLLQGMIYG
jgi:Zn-dependent protease